MLMKQKVNNNVMKDSPIEMGLIRNIDLIKKG